MRIEVDFDLCEANGMCEAVAPDVFEIDDEDNLHIVAEPTPELRDSIEQAVQSCPKAALSLKD
ncbi:ferredoxin [Saccharopolyspora flava]|uniref:Ferredoxin n=1 Tax=Saccharopolyspora flava TaxID=95161 RepID=A0A1I6RFI9_9PSEU|nr:ferredoxin [Saccharopolyspora flava]SFS63483.1 ferredoxin [Saccharopolyspora flava]